MWLPRAGDRGDREMTANGEQAYFGGDENILKLIVAAFAQPWLGMQ